MIATAQSSHNDFFTKVERVDNTLGRIKVTDLSFKRETDSLQLWTGESMLGTLSLRGLSNLCRITSVSPQVIFKQDSGILNTVLKTQLAGKHEELQFLRNPTTPEEIISLFPGKEFYTPYSALMASSRSNIWSIRGDPVASETVSFFIKIAEPTIEGENFYQGAVVRVSPTNTVPAVFGQFFERLSCTNMALDKYLYNPVKLKGVTGDVVKAVLSDFGKQCAAMSAQVSSVFKAARACPFDAQRHLGFLDTVSLPKTVRGKYDAVISAPDQFKEELAAAHVDKLEMVYDHFNLLTHLCKQLESMSTRNGAEERAWLFLMNLHRSIHGKN